MECGGRVWEKWGRVGREKIMKRGGASPERENGIQLVQFLATINTKFIELFVLVEVSRSLPPGHGKIHSPLCLGGFFKTYFGDKSNLP